MAHNAQILQTKKAQRVHNIFTTVINQIGGDMGVLGMSGSINASGMKAILDTLHMPSGSKFVDVGAGVGRVLIHVASLYPKVERITGYEFDDIKAMKAIAAIPRAIDRIIVEGINEVPVAPVVLHKDVLALQSLRDATHVFSFWQGMGGAVRDKLGQLLRAGNHVQRVAIVQHAINGDPVRFLVDEHGFPPSLTLEANFPVRMISSGSQMQAYVFRK